MVHLRCLQLGPVHPVVHLQAKSSLILSPSRMLRFMQDPLLAQGFGWQMSYISDSTMSRKQIRQVKL